MECPACNALMNDDDVECSACGLRLDLIAEESNDAPVEDDGEHIQFVLAELVEQKGVFRSAHYWNVLVTKSMVVIYQADSGSAALLGGIGIMVAHMRRVAKAKELTLKSVEEATRHCSPVFKFDRSKGAIRIPCYGNPGGPVALTLYRRQRMHKILLPVELALQLQAACPELVLEPWPAEDRKSLAAAILGFPLAAMGGITLMTIANISEEMAQTGGRGVPLSYLIGMLMLLGGAFLASWSQRTDRLEPGRRKSMGRYLIVLGVLGLPGSLMVLAPILEKGTTTSVPGFWQFLRVISFAASVVVAGCMIWWGVRSRRNGKSQLEERRKLQPGQELQLTL